MKLEVEKPVTISWKILWVIITLIFGFSAWMTTMQYQAIAQANDIVEVKEEIKIMKSIDRRLYRIEIKLGVDEKK